MAFCANCGKALDSEFCVSCGQRTGLPHAPVQAAVSTSNVSPHPFGPPPSRPRRHRWWVAGGVFSVVVLGLGIYVFMPRSVTVRDLRTNPLAYKGKLVTLSCIAGTPIDAIFWMGNVCTDHGGSGCDVCDLTTMEGIYVGTAKALPKGQRVTVAGRIYTDLHRASGLPRPAQGSEVLFCEEHSACESVLGQDRGTVEPGDGKTAHEYDVGYKPVEVGRRYTGRMAEGGKSVPVVLEIVNLDGSKVTAKLTLPGQKPDEWTGTYDLRTRKLSLAAPPADSMELQYADGGKWMGLQRIAKSRSQFAVFDMELSAR